MGEKRKIYVFTENFHPQTPTTFRGIKVWGMGFAFTKEPAAFDTEKHPFKLLGRLEALETNFLVMRGTRAGWTHQAVQPVLVEAYLKGEAAPPDDEEQYYVRRNSKNEIYVTALGIPSTDLVYAEDKQKSARSTVAARLGEDGRVADQRSATSEVEVFQFHVPRMRKPKADDRKMQTVVLGYTQQRDGRNLPPQGAEWEPLGGSPKRHFGKEIIDALDDKGFCVRKVDVPVLNIPPERQELVKEMVMAQARKWAAGAGELSLNEALAVTRRVEDQGEKTLFDPLEVHDRDREINDGGRKDGGWRPSEENESGRPQRKSDEGHTAEDQKIIASLEKIVPSAALSYKQAIIDLADGSRISFRGPALELREALRETLDHLAPDGRVIAMPGYVQEKQRSGPTMKQKVRFILGKKASDAPEQAVTALEEAIGTLTRSVYERSSRAAHVASERKSVEQVRRYVVVVLHDILEM